MFVKMGRFTSNQDNNNNNNNNNETKMISGSDNL